MIGLACLMIKIENTVLGITITPELICFVINRHIYNVAFIVCYFSTSTSVPKESQKQANALNYMLKNTENAYFSCIVKTCVFT